MTHNQNRKMNALEAKLFKLATRSKEVNDAAYVNYIDLLEDVQSVRSASEVSLHEEGKLSLNALYERIENCMKQYGNMAFTIEAEIINRGTGLKLTAMIEQLFKPEKDSYGDTQYIRGKTAEELYNNVVIWAKAHYEQWIAQGNSLPEVVVDLKNE